MIGMIDYKGIETHLTQDEVELLQKYCRFKKVLEIGCYIGGSTVAIAEVAFCVTSVDTFVGLEWRPGENPNKLYYDCIRNTSKCHNSKILRGDSQEIVPILNDTFDVVFVDGDHRYESVLNDIKNAFTKLNTNGIILCHDYGTGPEVTKALDYCVSLFMDRKDRLVVFDRGCMTKEFIVNYHY